MTHQEEQKIREEYYDKFAPHVYVLYTREENADWWLSKIKERYEQLEEKIERYWNDYNFDEVTSGGLIHYLKNN